MQAINSFAFLQSYAIVKKYTKMSKKGIVRKAILIYNCNKVYTIEHWCKKNTLIRKTDCLFDMVAIIQNRK